MRRLTWKRVLLGTLVVLFLVAEGLLVAYVHRTEARVNYMFHRAEAAAERAEAAAR